MAQCTSDPNPDASVDAGITLIQLQDRISDRCAFSSSHWTGFMPVCTTGTGQALKMPTKFTKHYNKTYQGKSKIAALCPVFDATALATLRQKTKSIPAYLRNVPQQASHLTCPPPVPRS